ncbi:MAG TPA: hypothetical protein VKA30_10950 [Actinomycetota bacterium]|nr:hypothetical protein [Actinomycetota bacterium]
MIEDPRPEEVPEALVHVLRHALHLGLEAVRAHGSPVAPFALLESEGERRVEVFRPTDDGQEPSLEDCLQAMRDRAPLLAFEAERVAVVYDGYLELEETEPRDAVFAEGIERGMGTSVTVAQPYLLAGRRRKVRTIGEPILLEQGRHFIR